MKNTALLTGPYDWGPALLPLAEFQARLSAARRSLAACGATSLLVHGNSIEYGALAYLTGFVPKLGPAFALVPREGAIRILVSGGAGMIGSAKLLTWVEDVRPVGNLRNTLHEWLGETVRDGKATLALWGGNIMAQRAYSAIAGAIQPFGSIIDMDDRLDALRRRKSLRELELLREACRILAIARGALERATGDGSNARNAALAAERAAFAAGAQDVRILASARNGGPPLPFDDASDIRVAPLLASLGVRFAGYWAEGLITIGAPQDGALARAEAALRAMLREVRPGATPGDLARAAAQHLTSYKFHPLVETSVGNGIGLSFEEPPILGHEGKTRFEQGGVYTVRSGAMGERGDNAIVSAMVAVTANGIDILWASINHSASKTTTKGPR